MRLFTNKYLEILLKSSPWMYSFAVWLIYVFILFFMYYCDVSIFKRSFLFILGCLVWLLMDLSGNLFIVYYKYSISTINILIFILHDMHLKFPKNTNRICTPISISICFYICLFIVLRLLFSTETVMLVLNGVVFMFVLCELIHYLLHYCDDRILDVYHEYYSSRIGDIFARAKYMHSQYHDVNIGGYYGISYLLIQLFLQRNK